MGLCLGFSLLSVVELIYFFTLRWCVLCCRRKGGGGGGIQNMVIWVVKFSRGRNTKLEVGCGGYACLALRTRGLGTRVPRSNPGAATFALFAKLRKRDFRRLHPQV